MDLQTNYLGIKLKNPLVVSSCPLSEKLENIKAMEQAGAAAIVMYSVFEEEICYDDDMMDCYLHYGTDQFVEALTYFPMFSKQKNFLSNYLCNLKQAVSAVNIPIIGSLNVTTVSKWLDYAIQMQDTGIQALELNLYYPVTNIQSSDVIEKYYLNTVQELKSKLRIPLVVKLSPFFTSINEMAMKLTQIGGANGLVIFDRFYYPDFDIYNLKLDSALQLSSSFEARLPLRWISILYNKLPASIAASTGVHNHTDLIKYILAGADVVMCASCLMKHGIPYLGCLLAGLENWLKNNKYKSIKEIRGLMSKDNVTNPEELDKLPYMRILKNSFITQY